MNFTYHIPTRILFGPGSFDQLNKEQLPGTKALIVISAGPSMKKHGYLDRLTNILNGRGIEFVLFDKILPNPINLHVDEGAQLARSTKCDFVIGLGGGSSIDSAKSIALMATNQGDYWDYIHGGSGKGQPVKNSPLPIVAITTTAGTGTEADPWTVVTHQQLQEKIGFGLLPETFPTLSVVDPELMVSVPPILTAYQGFDAFFHAAEGYIATCATPVSDIYALESISLLSSYLPRAVENGSDIEARTQVALANTLSGFVESTSSCTSEHSIEHALSAFHPDLPHGAGLIMLSVAYFSFFADHLPQRFSEMARAMGQDTGSVPATEQPGLFIEALKEMQRKCGVDQLKMSDYGVSTDEFEALADNAFTTMGALFTLDRVKLSKENIVSILKESYR
ncbi:MAG: iron-containing alcohol dehydrogenase [Desulfobulbaceae bacterium]|nr:MAG: iron-containing alcohol dehydrogenase [Desulfobulbaceae bacterium]